MMNTPPVLANYSCVHCGAKSQSKEGRCWLCYEDRSTPNPFGVTGKSITEDLPATPASAQDAVFGILLGICVLLTILIGVGLAIENRGLLIPFAIFMSPAYAVTILRGIAQASSNSNPRPASIFFTFVISLIVTILASIVLIVAATIMFFLVCIGAFGNW